MVELSTQSDIQEKLKWKFINEYEYSLGNIMANWNGTLGSSNSFQIWRWPLF